MKKIDTFVIVSIILAIISISGFFIFAHEGSLWSSPMSLSKIIYKVYTWSAVSLISLIMMTIGIIKSKVTKKTRHLGFALTLPIVMIESFFAFAGIAAFALVVVIAYIATYKLWKI
ncbi:MAG: hypothetical protein KJ620_03360 [Candidatus Edwardsbacteria bacterium]|nr:hypothetical protein [Candidatus Edwardsbacteria bacterium]MBU1577138.1 hypothetical protein [Candidatus Edwardsbacteria bacterium]MBU2463784.1 hypothetical protein [Candidatus Edwardsbacteria bacterium]MBU2593766.1 hypothetical protein [Candidatus Edwardsbacteria bacterium]